MTGTYPRGDWASLLIGDLQSWNLSYGFPFLMPRCPGDQLIEQVSKREDMV